MKMCAPIAKFLSPSTLPLKLGTFSGSCTEWHHLPHFNPSSKHLIP